MSLALRTLAGKATPSPSRCTYFALVRSVLRPPRHGPLASQGISRSRRPVCSTDRGETLVTQCGASAKQDSPVRSAAFRSRKTHRTGCFSTVQFLSSDCSSVASQASSARGKCEAATHRLQQQNLEGTCFCRRVCFGEAAGSQAGSASRRVSGSQSLPLLGDECP